ncbi:MAG: site-specific integrase [Armatimonadetes bacterium]|nr:site-specific integrase [Armatimonadota bacterium]
MSLAQAIQEFLAFLEIEKSARPHTLDAYRRDFALLARYLGGHGLPAEVETLTAAVLRG